MRVGPLPLSEANPLAKKVGALVQVHSWATAAGEAGKADGVLDVDRN